MNGRFVEHRNGKNLFMVDTRWIAMEVFVAMAGGSQPSYEDIRMMAWGPYDVSDTEKRSGKTAWAGKIPATIFFLFPSSLGKCRLIAWVHYLQLTVGMIYIDIQRFFCARSNLWRFLCQVAVVWALKNQGEVTFGLLGSWSSDFPICYKTIYHTYIYIL